MNDNAEITGAQIMSGLTMTVRVRGLRRLRVRLWIGMQFVRFGAFVMGVGQLKVE